MLYWFHMSEFYLDLRDKPRVIDFLVDALPYLASKQAREVEAWVQTYQAGEKLATDKLAEIARKVAQEAWPVRDAIQSYVSQEGSEEEWSRVIAFIRPGTAQALKRFRQKSHVNHLTEILKQEDVSLFLSEEQVEEVLHIRLQAWQDLWKEKQLVLRNRITEAKKRLTEYQDHLAKLRELALSLPSFLQNELLGKIASYEDQLFFEMKEVPLEIFGEELHYYTDQKEVSPLE